MKNNALCYLFGALLLASLSCMHRPTAKPPLLESWQLDTCVKLDNGYNYVVVTVSDLSLLATTAWWAVLQCTQAPEHKIDWTTFQQVQGRAVRNVAHIIPFYTYQFKVKLKRDVK